MNIYNVKETMYIICCTDVSALYKETVTVSIVDCALCVWIMHVKKKNV
jgi:hypothetical protein